MDPTEGAVAQTALRAAPSAYRRHLRKERYRSNHGIAAAAFPATRPPPPTLMTRSLNEVATSTPIMEDFVPQSMFVRRVSLSPATTVGPATLPRQFTR